MAKSKRFSTAQDFELQLNLIIEGLIDYHSRLPELEKKDIQVAEIAEKLDVSTNTLRRWCQEFSGVSAREFLAIYRVEKAKLLLKSGVKSSDIAHQLAFTEHKTFSALFKRHAHKTPSNFANSLFSAETSFLLSTHNYKAIKCLEKSGRFIQVEN